MKQSTGLLALLQVVKILAQDVEVSEPWEPTSTAVRHPMITDPPEAAPRDLAPMAASLAAQSLPAGARGFQGGMIYDMGKPRIEANISSISGKGDASVFACYNSVIDWNIQHRKWENSTRQTDFVFPKTVVNTSVVVTISSDEEAATYTRCDGIRFPPTNTITPISLTFLNKWTSTNRAYATPQPSCTIAESQCDQVYTAFSTATYSYISSVYSQHFADRKTGIPAGIDFRLQTPPCPKPETACPPKTEIENCSLNIPRATVFYWPTSVKNHCEARETINATPTIQGAPNTAVFSGMTVTSPSALVVANSVLRDVRVYASLVENEWDYVHKRCGFHVEAKMAVNPTDMTTYRLSSVSVGTFRQSGSWATRYTETSVKHPFDFADMARTQVPREAWLSGGNNLDKESTIMQDYRPILSIPTAVVSADPEFAGCSYNDLRGYFVEYVPITATSVGMPQPTFFGAQASVGPISTSVGNIMARVGRPTGRPVPLPRPVPMKGSQPPSWQTMTQEAVPMAVPAVVVADPPPIMPLVPMKGS